MYHKLRDLLCHNIIINRILNPNEFINLIVYGYSRTVLKPFLGSNTNTVDDITNIIIEYFSFIALNEIKFKIQNNISTQYIKFGNENSKITRIKYNNDKWFHVVGDTVFSGNICDEFTYVYIQY